jgi:hypothetical protein
MKKSIIFLFFTINLSLIIAQSNFDVSAEIRPRFQMDNKDFNSDLPSNNFTELRTRLGLNFSPTENIEGFVQIQDSRIYGTEPNTLTSTDNIDLHQAYFNVNKLFDLPFNLKLGRMELSYGPQRLIGAVGWHNVGRSFDGGVLQFDSEKIDIDLFSAKINEQSEPGDTNDTNLIGLYGNLKMIDNYKIQPFFISDFLVGSESSRYTIGVYINGNINNFSHELEAAYQLGSVTKDIDIAAYMFALNLKYSFNTPIKPNVGVGIDYLSGDENGVSDNESSVFNSLFATNHKYYGFMDFFINIPNDTYGLGLMDIHAKGEITPADKFKTALAFHIFNSTADITLLDRSKLTSFGTELDLTLTYSYNSGVNFVGGFSFFTPGEIFELTRGKDSSTWIYLMAVVNL